MVEHNLEVGEYEATWTLSGYDTLKARIEVKDTGVTCISVTAGACNSSTPPGVRVSAFTVTGHLKSAVAPPAEMTKSDFLTEIQNRGEIDLSKITTSSGWNKWVKKGYAGYWRIDYSDGTKYLIEIWNLHAQNPPTRESDIHFFDIRLATPTAISKIETAWVLARINALPFVGAPPPVEIGSWIDESGVTNLTPSHAMYVYYLSQGATGAADTKYAGLSPKPSRMDPSIATVDNAMGIFYYSQGAMGAGNAKTGCNY